MAASNFALTREYIGLQAWRRRAGEGALVAANSRARSSVPLCFKRADAYTATHAAAPPLDRLMRDEPILILGAGINGAAIAREFLLNGVGVCLVDSADLAAGTTAYSSRLIHGGLRYLEHAEFHLVRESLAERRRLLRLAPQFVQPLRLYIPISSRVGGLGQAAARFLRLRTPRHWRSRRGLWLVQLGLWLYDAFARTERYERRATHAVDDANVPRVSAHSYSWLCSYMDAQVAFPERLVVALLRDCQRLAECFEVPFRLFTYRQAVRRGDTIELAGRAGQVEAELRPAAIVNATGAWVDRTLQSLNVPSRRLIGGTKGSHLVTCDESMRRALGGHGVYVEAADGRPVFILPLGQATLIGTTDVVYEAPPETAVASEGEVEYLLSTANALFPDAQLSRDDVLLHYSGVRPLPFAGDTNPAAITRRHTLHVHQDADPPMFSVIGGKLTTCRSLAEETVGEVLSRSGRDVQANSRDRALPGAEGFPTDPAELAAAQDRLATATGATSEQVRSVWTLCGSEARKLLDPAPTGPDQNDQNLAGTHIPLRAVRRVIREEWVVHLADLVERRLMLLYDRQLTAATLRQLAQTLAEEGVLEHEQIDKEVALYLERLATHFGRGIQ